MTSQKSLKNNVNANDFKRSLVGSLLFPIIAFLVLFFTVAMPVIGYVTSKDFLTAIEHNEISMFIVEDSAFYYMFELIPIGMIICGMLTAVKSFNYLLSKKQVNVFLSLGIKRNTMFINRFLSGVITLFVAVFVPLFVTYITNAISFGMSVHLTELFLYFVSLLFVSGLFGFAVTAMMIMASGNIFEVSVSTLAVTFIPSIVYGTGNYWMGSYLRGYTRTTALDKWIDLLNPWTIATNFGNDALVNEGHSSEMYIYTDSIKPIHLLQLLQRDTSVEKYEIPEIYKVDWGFMLPIVFWLVVSLVLVGVTFYLFNKRKAEHANSLGKFALTRAVICTFAFVVVAYFLFVALGYNLNWIPVLLIIVALSLIVYFGIQLVLSRKFKTAFKSLAWYGVLSCILVVFAVIIGTGFFGTYNKTPEKEELKSVSISVDDMTNFAHYIYPRDEYNNYVKATSDESKEAVFEAFEILKNEKIPNDKSDILTTVTVAFTYKDDAVKYRAFDIYNEETYVKYLEAIYGSDFFDALLKNYLLDEISESEHDDSGHLRKYMWSVTDTDMLEVMNGELDYIDDVEALCEALYKDMSTMTFDQLLRNTNKPMALLFRSSKGEDYPGTIYMRTEDKYFIMSDVGYVDKSEYVDYDYYLLDNFIPVYAEMTNTVKFLKDNGYEFEESTLKIKEILYTDSPLNYNDATTQWIKANEDNYRGWGTYENRIMEHSRFIFEDATWRLYDQWTIGYFIDEDTTEYELMKDIYKDAGHPLTSVTDEAEIDKIMDKAVAGEYLISGDNGRYVYVIYEEGMIIPYYIPEVNADVVK